MGSYYDPIRTAIISGLRALLADYPQLPDLTMMDDTPTANSETRAWIQEQVAAPAAAQESAPAEPVQEEWSLSRAGRDARQRRSSAQPPDTYELAMQAARSGRPQDGIELLMRELGQERSGRGRFHRKVQLSQLCVSTSHENIALPILQELAAEIERRKLEDWEAPDLVARPLALLYQMPRQKRRRRRAAGEAVRVDLPAGPADGAERFEITYGALGTGTDRHAIGAGAADRPRTEGSSEGAPTRAQSVRLLRASVRRDLEWLLNTRRTPAAADEAYPEVAKSVYNYGLPDLNALNWESSRDRTRLARAVQESLHVFEPRLRGIQVVPLEPVAGRSARHAISDRRPVGNGSRAGAHRRSTRRCSFRAASIR